jgi:hypothetical protein
MAIRTNDDLDTLAAGVSSGNYGPLTRVGDLPAIDDNSDIELEYTTANDNTVWLSWRDFQTSEVYVAKIKQVEGPNVIMKSLKTEINALNTTINAYSTPYTWANVRETEETLRALKEIRGFNLL